MKKKGIISIIGFLLIIAIVGLQLISILQYKAFWLDENFIIWNLKLKSFQQLFDPLDYIQKFPKIYLISIKAISMIFDEYYFSYRLLPFLAQLANFYLIIFILAPKLFPKKKIAQWLIIFIFVTNAVTLDYFSQIKPYTIDLLTANFAILQFFYLQKMTNDPNSTSIKKIVLLSLSIFICTFFSYTYPILVSPVILFSIISVKRSKKFLFPIVFFLFAISFQYYIDLHYTLSNKEQYQNFSPFLFSISEPYLSLKHIYQFFSINFSYPIEGYHFGFLFLLKITRILLVLFSLIYFSYHTFDKLKKITFSLKTGILSKILSVVDFDLYILTCLLAIIVLYILRLLPLGVFRLNYFAVIIIAYSTIQGVYLIQKKFDNNIKQAGVMVVIFSISFRLVYSKIFLPEGHASYFNQEIYDNMYCP